MKKGKSVIAFILDRSGSMMSVVNETIDGFNEFVNGQKAAPGECELSLIQFDEEYQVDYSNRDIHSVEKLNRDTFVPRGMTALYDSIGRTINQLGGYLGTKKEEERPEHVIVVIQTDGQENSSKEFTATKIADMIKHQKEKYSWQFVFLGADQDATLSAKKIGIGAGFAMGYGNNLRGVSHAFKSTTDNISMVRAGLSASASYSTEQLAAGEDSKK